ncbi:hypothetical protein KKI24_24915 [bacterium]|nr:hypothetical protein [bacterium]
MKDISAYSPGRNTEFNADDLVCFCYGYTRKDIETDYVEHHGQSFILKRIALEKKEGKCDCTHKNPKGH